ncbi:Fur-regulated basic protein FbpA [Niallia taxi]|uniref:Fur-regulated basic protein FbpA n=1 Tax=Niallia taxi TaxID=2499688 RepID=UPI0021A56D37|nr:Fur-regulated basic protein FbpA [Niallia taxi]MCT2345877.1 Fur-regulated basic protein FbpA [Niallia taxi]MED3962682.1 Fur-regulated basic protein FbpA [Niallia taxi]
MIPLSIWSNAVEVRRAFIIDQLLSIGIYKKENVQLYELSLSELESEYYLHIRGKRLWGKRPLKN